MSVVRIEHAPRAVLETLQLERLQGVVGRLKRLPRGADLPEIASLDDLRQIPFTVKDDLRASYPLGLLAVPRDELRRIHASSGTGGSPTVVAYTEHDLDVWSKVMARCMAMAGVRAGMTVHNAYGYGLFTGGLGFHQGAERLGALVVPVSGGVTARQAALLRDLDAQVLCCTPSYALHIAQGLREAGVEPSDLKLEIGMFGAEPWTEGMRERLESELGLTALNIYGLSEIIGPGVSAECPEARDGLHVQEDHFLVEAIDPDTGEPVEDGVDGELVFTTLTKEALPLLRYRTGDIASLTHERCTCGRTFARMSAVRGRRDDMLIVRGVNLYPSQIEHVLLGQAGVAPHYQLVVERPETLDEVTVCCEPIEHGTNPIALGATIQKAIRAQIGVTVTVHVKAPGEIPRSEGKAVRVIDRREQR
jgi:phenylacetate-CoA ligase